ncbi:MAG: PilZ domain-containing protein [Candidatus Electrothrix sp. Rat3]|nr:PilZ domain-containing protein [Candidatus Electrothrix rattekaaiensis]
MKFIDWQKVRLENAEQEKNRLKKELVELKKELIELKNPSNGEKERGPHNNTHRNNIKKTTTRVKAVTPMKIQKQDNVKPEDVQQLLVKNIQQLLVNIGSRNKRQFTRLHIQLDADLDFGSQRYYRHPVEDISLGGLYVNGEFHQQVGDICTISLNHSEIDEILEIHAACSVVRSNAQGIGLEFLSMKLDDFCHLQTVLLYQADDPATLGTEFVNNINIELEDDLVLCNTFRFQEDKNNKSERPTL